MQLALLFSVFFIAVCGLVYELVSSALASYLLGDSITQFSTVIGAYLFAMGIGSWLSTYVTRNLLGFFIQVEILIAIVGGTSAALLFSLFEHVNSFRFLLYGTVGLVGILVGLEIPIVMRILKDRYPFKDLVARVFTFDYIGALGASLLFPLVLVPRLGLVRTSFFFGIVNVCVALWTLFMFRREVPWARSLRVVAVAVLALLVTGFALSDRIMAFSEEAVFPDDVVFSRTSPYQRLVVTRGGNDLRLFINGNLQFSSRDEYRYHETLVHVGLAAAPRRQKVLILGGGDGLAAREALKYPDVESITLVDLDPMMTRIFRTHAPLVELNGGALTDERVKVINADAFTWLSETKGVYDFVVIDFPDPSSYSLGKLYTTAFYQRLRAHLAPDAAFVVQSTSPIAARQSYWCIVETIEASGFETTPYHAYVPSFGEWGFVLGSRRAVDATLGTAHYPAGMRFLKASGLAALLEFPPDMARVDSEVNKLNNQALVRYFDEEWSEYVR